MAFTVVADVPEERLERSVRKLAASFFSQTGESALPTGTGLVPPVVCRQLPARRFDITRNRRNHQVNCVLGSTAPSLYAGEDRVAAVLLANILGGPASNSILNAVLREKNGWVYGVECSYTQYSDTGILAICLGCEKDNLDRCLKAVSRELGRLMSAPLSDRRLMSAKKQLLGQLAISGDNGETQCLSMGKSLLSYGRVLSAEENRDLIEAVTARKIQELACDIFDDRRLSRLVFI